MSVLRSVQEHRPPGSVEQPIYDEHPGSASAPSNLWELCEVVAYFALEVRRHEHQNACLGARASTSCSLCWACVGSWQTLHLRHGRSLHERTLYACVVGSRPA